MNQNIEKSKDKIIYIVTLLFSIFIYLAVPHSIVFLRSVSETGIIISIEIYHFISQFILYNLFKDKDKKYYLIRLIRFFIIIFIISAIDSLYLIYNEQGYFRLENVFGLISVALMLVMSQFLSSVFLLDFLNKYIEKGRKIKNYLIYMLRYAFQSSITIVIFAALDYIVYLYAFNYSNYYDYNGFLVVFVIIFISSIVIYLLTNLFTILISKRLNTKNFTFYLSLILLLVIAIYYRKPLLSPINKIIENIEYKNYLKKKEDKEKNEIMEKKMLAIKNSKEEIENVVSKYNMVNDFTKANVGDIVKFGKSFLKSDVTKKIDSYYYVFDKNDDEITLISLYYTDKVLSNDIKYDDNNLKIINYLDTTFYENAFNDEEKAHIVKKVYEDGKEHYVFVPGLKFITDDKNKEINNNEIVNALPNVQVYDNYINSVDRYQLEVGNINYGMLLSNHFLKPKSYRFINIVNRNMQIEIYDRVAGSVISHRDMYLRPVITLKIK